MRTIWVTFSRMVRCVFTAAAGLMRARFLLQPDLGRKSCQAGCPTLSLSGSLCGLVCRDSNGEVLLNHVWVAQSAIERLVGLLLAPRIDVAVGLLLRACCGIHSFGMRQEIGVVALSENGKVLGVWALQPGRMLRFPVGASLCLEIHPKRIPVFQKRRGHTVEFVDCNLSVEEVLVPLSPIA